MKVSYYGLNLNIYLTYLISLFISDYDEKRDEHKNSLSLDFMTVHVRVRESNSMEDFLRKAEMAVHEEKAKYQEVSFMKSFNFQEFFLLIVPERN